jgi:hypothetical protein
MFANALYRQTQLTQAPVHFLPQCECPVEMIVAPLHFCGLKGRRRFNESRFDP